MCIEFLLPLLAAALVLLPAIVKQDDEETAFIEDLLSKMTLKEKIGQITLVSQCVPNQKERISRGEAGSTLTIFNPQNRNEWPKLLAELQNMQRAAVENSRLGIPLILGLDVIHGYQTTFPVPLAEAASFNPSLLEKTARVGAWEAARDGIHWIFAPMMDVARDPRWGRIMEGAGEDPVLGATMAVARVKGIQGDNPLRPENLAACAKHFVGYGAVEAGLDYNTTDISERRLREVYLPPFKAAVEAGVSTIMTSFNDINGIPASGNTFILRKILRDEWGFDGYVVSDWNAVGEMIVMKFAANQKEAAKKALAAGVDMEMIGWAHVSDAYSGELESLVAEGVIEENLIDEAVARVLRIKKRYGLFENPYPDKEYFAQHPMPLEERKATALQAARESMVLLKNVNGALPLKSEPCRIALIGPQADDPVSQCGNWIVQPDYDNVSTLRKALIEKAGKENVLYEKGCDFEGNDRSGFAAAIEAAEKADVIIANMGESGNMSGEARSKTDINFPTLQLELLKELKALGKPVILVLSNGRPIIITKAVEYADAVLESWLPGEQGGKAVVNILFGEYNPSGKLPVTFPWDMGQIPIYHSVKPTGRPEDPNNEFSTRYIDAPLSPLYPFGFGLSYTEFTYSNLTLTPERGSGADGFELSVTVTNSGVVDGEEVVQLYLDDKVATIAQPVMQFKAFRKIELRAGESRDVTFRITPAMLSFWNQEMEYTWEPGEFEALVGGNPHKLEKAIFTATE